MVRLIINPRRNRREPEVDESQQNNSSSNFKEYIAKSM